VSELLAAWPLPLTAMAAGFLGSVHCLGMCGGVSGMMAVAARTPPSRQSSDGMMALAIPVTVVPATRTIPTASGSVLAFNAGRIASYAIAGAIAASAGALVGQAWLVGSSFPLRASLFVFANLMIVLTGLYLMGLPQLLAPLERAGGRLWRRLSPYTKRFLPMDSLPRAAAFGLLWGWIPCGLVYAMLLTAMSAGNAGMGALTMLAFGIGTLPAMLSAGLMAGQLRRWTRDSRVRLTAGAMVVALGLWGLMRAESLASLQAFGALCAQAMS